MRDLAVSSADKHTALVWRNTYVSWDDLVARLATPVRTAETQAEYWRMSKTQRTQVKDVGGFVGGHLRGGRRRAGHVLARSMLTLDIDKPGDGFLDQLAGILPAAWCVYTTHSATVGQPRFRLLMPLARDVSPDEHGAISRRIAADLGLGQIDPASFRPNQVMFWPSASSDGYYDCQVNTGDWLDPDKVLARYTDWTDQTTWPGHATPHTTSRLANPRGKNGMVGAFCRAYTVSEAIDAFLTGVYEPTAIPDRYTFTGGTTAGGVTIHESDTYAYSYHASDPAADGHAHNAFDLVRIHLYADLDHDTPPETPARSRPSYQAMTSLAANDQKVRRLLASEKLAQARTDFTATSSDGGGVLGEWMAGLEYEKRSGILKNNLHNLGLILSCDENLKSIVFNLQADSLEIAGTVPWGHPSRFWRDQDDAQLACYVDAHYGTFSQRNFQIAVTKVADDRSYHPIRDYLDGLPAWDGVPRVDTLLVDYLGAEDSAYTRAVTRKTLCAAVRRVREPGCKFDSMLVLNGPQGIGKSTLIARLAGEWFSDSLNLSDTKDKTAAEKLQGYWILEIGELAGLRKTEVETLRSFLSRQNDIYRASFGRRVSPHPRQCVFFGTTNAEGGYLRDTTGNRRFWPVITPGSGTKHSWDITKTDIDQVWAETTTYVQAGESLYLEADIQDAAKAQQQAAMETDEREGIIRDYLDTLLPEDWDDMDLYARRDYLDGAGEFGPVRHEGTVPRECVSNMEIWCECFGKNRADLTPLDSTRIRSILIKLGWSKAEKKKRLPLYGPQWVWNRPPVWPDAEQECSTRTQDGTLPAGTEETGH